MVIFRKKSDLEKVKISVGALGFEQSDLGKTNHNLDSVEVDLVRGMPNLQNLEMVCSKIKRFLD